MAIQKTERGAVEVFLPHEFANAMLSMLTCFVAADPRNKYGSYAAKLKAKILHHGRKFVHNGEENVSVYFYENEAAMLIKLFSIYASITGGDTTDYFSQIGKSKGA